MPTEAKRVADRGLHFYLAGSIGNVIQVTLGIRNLVADSRRQAIRLNRLGADCQFDRARGAEHVTSRAFGGADGHLTGVFAEDGLNRLSFGDVALRRRSPVGVDVSNLLRLKPSVPQRYLHAARCPFAFRRRRRQMARVRGISVADDFAVNFRSALFSMVEVYEDETASAFSHHKPIALLVKGPRRVLRIIIARAHPPPREKSADADRNNGSLPPAAEDDLRAALFHG